MHYPTLRLNPKADYRLKHGHLWVYSNEIDNKHFPLTNLQPGELAIVENAMGKKLGLAYVNPNTLICARMLTNDMAATLDFEFFTQRIADALKLRTQIFSKPYYRLVYGESDFLPGLVIDRFGDTIVIQIATAGMEKFVDTIVTVIDKLIAPKTIVVKNDSKMREVEGLASYVKAFKGSDIDTISLIENDVNFIAPLKDGQKTGWFYDHRLMRARLPAYVQDKRVLDLFSYVGGWGIQAAKFGAKEVVCADISPLALEYVQKNAKLNALTNVSVIQDDAFNVLQNLHADKEKFDLIILDPPAFIPRRKDIPKGGSAYQKANMQAMQLLSSGGIIFSGSCSMHLQPTDLSSFMHNAALKLNRQLQILEQGHQGPDHPIHPAIPETQYLKSFVGIVK